MDDLTLRRKHRVADVEISESNGSVDIEHTVDLGGHNGEVLLTLDPAEAAALYVWLGQLIPFHAQHQAMKLAATERDDEAHYQHTLARTKTAQECVE